MFNNITTDLIMERLKSFILRYYPNFVCSKFWNGSYFLTLCSRRNGTNSDNLRVIHLKYGVSVLEKVGSQS